MKDYRDPEGLSDAVLLDRLLNHGDELKPEEFEAFQDMAYRIPHAKHGLSSKQRLWAESVYNSADLQRHYAEKYPKQEPGRHHPLDDVMAKRALTPPGR